MNQMKVADPTLIKFLDVINTSIKKFRALINDISTVARMESENSALEMVDLNEIINNIEWSLADKIVLSKTTISRNLEVDHIKFSKKNLRSIIYNLISNGIKFKSDKPPVLTIKTEKRNGDVVLSVQDNGIGIAASEQKKIFEIYRRLNDDVEGRGIGLYLAKKIVDASGGNMIVESEPGRGSRFIIYFKS